MNNLSIKNRKLNINTTNRTPYLDSGKCSKLTIIDIDNDLNITHQYAEICQQHAVEDKWILMINPDEQPLEQLSKSYEINTTNILKVLTNKVNLVLLNIEKALTKGNCSAIVLCNPLLNDQEIAQLEKCAQYGKTACIVIRNNRRIH